IIRELPFDSDRKMMSVVIKDGDQYQVLTKGAPDVILAKTDAILDHDQLVTLPAGQTAVEAQVNRFAEQ
ncbi:hypothetical protein BTJ08_09635, partial [Lactobacillus delbrueckii subsp. bulgaricus]|nr:hypothetical protein [Lactobacillus delbrueckii subsp. bulgaricus]